MTEPGTRGQILLTAGAIFAELGFECATVRRISEAAGVNVAAINYHFGDKESLYVATVRHAYGTRSSEVPMPDWTSADSPAECLRGFVSTLLTRMMGTDEIPWQSRLMMREVLRPTNACKHLVREHFRPHIDVLCSIIDRLVERPLPPHQRMQIAFSVMGQCLFYRVSGEVVTLMLDATEREEHYNLKQLADHITEFTLAAISTKNRPDSTTNREAKQEVGGMSS